MQFDHAQNLIDAVQSCRRCQSMVGCVRVLSEANGPFSAKVMFVGEAPGRLGADRTAVPFHGDKAGDNFEALLALSGLNRRDVFVTNAVLCNPRDEKGNNAPPSRQNLVNCADNLKAQIDVIKPSLVITLGAAALEATRLIESHALTLSNDVRTSRNWFGRVLAPLYHPGARAMIHRGFAMQTADYYYIGELARRLSAPRRKKRANPNLEDDSWDIVRFVMSKLQSCSLFKLHKTLYLIDFDFKKSFNDTLTSFFYIRQKDGPYCVELGSKWFKSHSDIKVSMKDGQPWLTWIGSGLFDPPSIVHDETRARVEEIMQTVFEYSDRQIKTRAYLTRPMKDSLRAERAGTRQLNAALL